jgi:hypothetical protein
MDYQKRTEQMSAEMPEDSEYEKFLKKQKVLCNQYGVDFSKVPDLDQKILALGKVNQKILDEFIIPSYKNVIKNSKYWAEIWGLSHDEKKDLTPKQKSLLSLFSYFSLAEGMVAENVQIITFLLMQNGHDLYDPRDMKFVDSYKKLGKIDLFIKLQFLERNGFTFITQAIDRNLRNCITHLEYTVNDDGTIINEKDGEKIIDIEQKMHLLSCSNTMVTLALNYWLQNSKSL